MSADPREDILARLGVILAAVPGIDHAQRNDLAVPESNGTYAILLDGDETASEAGFAKGRGPNGPNVIALMPEIYIVLEATAETAGPLMSRMRRRVIYAILNDSILTGLSMNGDIRYEGLQTAMAMGRSIAAEMGLNFTFNYMLYPTIAPDESTED